MVRPRPPFIRRAFADVHRVFKRGSFNLPNIDSAVIPPCHQRGDEGDRNHHPQENECRFAQSCLSKVGAIRADAYFLRGGTEKIGAAAGLLLVCFGFFTSRLLFFWLLAMGRSSSEIKLMNGMQIK